MIVKAHNGAVLATYDALKAVVPEEEAKKVLDAKLW
jgi:hypothetical protein